MPFNNFSPTTTLLGIINERSRDVSTIATIENGKLNGRWRNSGANARAIPTSSTDILDGDADGDLMYDASYVYLCASLNGALKWGRITIDSVW